jgi:RimJ/RimL family protein N-acetyltransferase
VSRAIAPVELSSERILLRPYRIEDADNVFAASIESVDTVGRWMPWCHAEYTKSESIAWIEKSLAMWQSGEACEFAAFDATNQYIGGAGLNQFDTVNNFANLGYWIRQSRQRQGLAAGVVAILAKFGFKTLGLTRIELVVATENVASRKVAEKTGAQFECVARNRLLIRGVPLGAAIYSFVPSDDT